MNDKLRRRATAGTGAILAAVLFGVLLEGGFSTMRASLDGGAATSVAEAAPVGAPSSPVTPTGDFSELADRAIPAVVQIRVTLSGAAGSMGEGWDQLPAPFRRFFDQPQVPGGERPRMGGGSGFLVRPDGYIVTNDHVVGDASEIQVTLSDHRTYDAELVGTDPTTDIAVIKIDGRDLPHLDWGRSSALRVGSWILAIGNPGVGSGQLESTLTAGIVSAKGRPLSLIGQGLSDDPRYGPELAGYAIENFIQTDAVINPGNSGGPMVDVNGLVVGVNSAIASTDGHYQGYGFAIPSDLGRKVAEDLIEHGVVRRPWLGVQVVAVTAEDAEAFGLPAVTGVVVQGVTDDSPAARAGIEQGDVIVSVDGHPILSGGDLQEQIAVLDPGLRTELGVYRDGRERTLEVRLGDSPGVGRERPTERRQRATSASEQRLGISLQSLDRQTAEALGYAEPGGIVVTEVDPMGPAASRGVIQGWRLDEVDGRSIRTLDDVADQLDGVDPGRVVTLHLSSPTGQSRIVNVRAR